MPETMEALEARYATQAGSFHSDLVDLNIPMSTVAAKVSQVLNLRNQLMAMYGVPADPKWRPNSGVSVPAAAPPKAGFMLKKPTAATKAAGAAGSVATVPEAYESAAAEVNFKSKLLEAATKQHRRTLNKDDFVFTVQGEGTSFTCTVESSLLSKTYSGEGSSKKAAESDVAMKAMQGDYNAYYQAVVSGSPMPKNPQGEKRKEPGEAAPVNEKSQLNQLVQVILKRPIVKDDIVYTVTEKDGKHIAQVAFPTYDASKKFSGAASTNKKEAELSAAKVALRVLQTTAKVAIEEHKSKKANTKK